MKLVELRSSHNISIDGIKSYIHATCNGLEADPSTAETFRKYAVFVFVGHGWKSGVLFSKDGKSGHFD